jgi:two-component system sensor histidine kinase KdpD
MTEYGRPDPDALLAQVKRERSQSARGKLKIFFGMSPGVGKTFAMLQAARQAQRQGREVVIGLVETHGRVETEALLEGLPIVPRTQLEYRETTLEEMDLDAILLWHPQLAVVDELAHTNAPGSRHPKRYQDVLELLDAGIDVYTTVNVQHIESRRDTIQQITGVVVRETVPDSVLDSADEIVLIDLTPEQLRSRLAEGKVYLGDRAATAAENFFRESNLTALREMSLRIVAEHVDRDLRDIMQEERIPGPWKSSDRLLAAVRGGATSEKLIRYTRRLAASMEASWLVVNVETGESLSAKQETQLNRDLALARRLGAEVITTPGTHVGEALLRIAQQHNVTQFVLGKPVRKRWFARQSSPVDWLVRHSGEIDIHMIRSEEKPIPRAERSWSNVGWREYGLAIAIAAVVTVVSLGIFEYTGYWAVALLYLFAVTLAGLRLRRGPTLLLAALSALLWNFLFIPPRYTFYISRLPDFMMFGIYFVVALVIGHLAARLREREDVERRREARATTLYRLTRDLAGSSDLGEGLRAIVRLIEETFHAQSAIYLRSESGLTPHASATLATTGKDESVAAWAFQKKQPAGMSTDTLPESAALHLPLLAGNRAEGVLAVRPPASLSHEQRELLDAFAAQLALYLHKERALQESREAQVATQSQKLQKALFDLVSHELRTPLAAMSATLQQPQPDCAELKQAARRLTRTVDTLLDATRLESGLLQPVREWCDPGDLLREAARQAGLGDRPVRIVVGEDLPHISVDSRLIEQALAALFSNSASYSPPDELIEASVMRDEGTIVFAVADRGPGLEPGEETKVFEKFYRGAGKPAGGLGLGLSIARQLVEAHGGTVIAQNRPAGGSRFSIRLPLGEPMRLPVEVATA